MLFLVAKIKLFDDIYADLDLFYCFLDFVREQPAKAPLIASFVPFFVSNIPFREDVDFCILGYFFKHS